MVGWLCMCIWLASLSWWHRYPIAGQVNAFLLQLCRSSTSQSSIHHSSKYLYPWIRWEDQAASSALLLKHTLLHALTMSGRILNNVFSMQEICAMLNCWCTFMKISWSQASSGAAGDRLCQAASTPLLSTCAPESGEIHQAAFPAFWLKHTLLLTLSVSGRILSSACHCLQLCSRYLLCCITDADAATWNCDGLKLNVCCRWSSLSNSIHTYPWSG